MARKAPVSGLSQAAFAAVMGVDPSQVTRWKAHGLPMLPDGQVDAVQGAAWVRTRVDNYKIRGSIGAREMGDGTRQRYRKLLHTAYVIGDQVAGVWVAELLLPLLPEATVRAVVAEFVRKSRESSASCMGEEFNPPAGVNSWLDTPEWKEPAPTDDEWEELLAEHAAGHLAKIGAGA